MEKWERNLKVILNKRDALLNQLNLTSGKSLTYLDIKHTSINDFASEEEKNIFSNLNNAIKEYDEALESRDQAMFGLFLDSLIHEKNPTKESQLWCANRY